MTGRGDLFVVSAPSGAGKSTLIGELVARIEGLRFSVSWTTRSPRPGEQDGREYHFTDIPTFREMMGRGEFLEWAVVHGEYYGTSRRQIEALRAAGADVILDIDVQGAEQVRRAVGDCRTIFILPPDFETLRRRLVARGTDAQEVIERRLRGARQELLRWRDFDFLVINDDLERAAGELCGIVLAARCRRERRVEQASRIVDGFPVEGTGEGEGS
ncbi:MAG: guanylate kinase [Acidobacteriota bacterium]|nr:guanylate kinase [Acidobacteriota bacterium]MDQ7086796.1 guanylate kinase [Acidobacteriota bacterium]